MYAQSADPARSDLVLEYCVQCHNPDDYSGRLDFWSFDLDDLHPRRETWEMVLRKLQSGTMPPLGELQPPAADLQAFLRSLTTDLDTLAGAERNAGRAPLARLNRAEYANAIRDLLGVEVDVSGLLPPDNESYGFDNIADVLSLSPVLLEQYLSASAKITNLAVGNPQTPLIATTYRIRPDFSQDSHIAGLPLGTRGGALVEHNFPVDGDYLISGVLSRNTADVVRGLEETHGVDFLVDGISRYRVTVGGDEDSEALTRNTTDARTMLGERLQLRMRIDAGQHRVGVTFIERNLARDDHYLQPFQRTTVDPVDEVGLPHLDSLIITGPLTVEGPGNSLSRQKIFICEPGADSDDELDCAYDILANLARRAYRRPVDEDDMLPLLRMFQAGRAQAQGSSDQSSDQSFDQSFDQGIQQALRLVISNPNFIFRFEPDPEQVAPGETYPLSPLQLASRLSFFLWSSIPDDELLQLAESGALADPEVLNGQVERMLADEKSFALSENFAGQWLLLRNLNAFSPNPGQFPDFDDNLRKAFIRETQLFFHSLITEDRSVLDLLNADYSFLDERLARHYGIPGVYGSRFRRVQMPEERRGLLGHGSVLAVNSYATRTSPVLRGKWILGNLMGLPPPPPPPDVADLQAVAEDGRLLSVREQMVRHRANPSCASCHNLMDPLGLALENFDAIGRWRLRDEIGTVVDASGMLADGTPLDGPVSLRRALLSRPELLATTFTEKMLTYALGRGLTYEDAAVTRQILRQAEHDNYRISTLVRGIVNSVPFRMKTRGEANSLTLVDQAPDASGAANL